MKKILVTGAAGYIGSVLVGELLQANYEVVGVDNLSFGGESLLALRNNPHFTFIKGDLTDDAVIEKIFKEHQLEGVIHLAAIVGDPACAKQPELAKKINGQVCLDLLAQAKKNRVPRFIFASTCSNYGKMSDPSSLVDENSALTPVSLYAQLKVSFEKMILQDAKKEDWFCPTSLRFATVYGASPRMRFDLTVNEFTKDLVMGKSLEVFGEKFWRPYVHVHDLARAILLVLKSDPKKVAYNVFNVGDTHENYQKEMIVKEIQKCVPSAKVSYVTKNEDPRDYRVSFEKIKKELGFTVTQKVPDGIKEIKYLIENNFWSNVENPRYKNT